MKVLLVLKKKFKEFPFARYGNKKLKRAGYIVCTGPGR